MKTSNVIAGGALGISIIGGIAGLVLTPMSTEITELHDININHEVRIQALEISEARTGVHLTNLTASIDRLVSKMDSGTR